MIFRLAFGLLVAGLSIPAAYADFEMEGYLKDAGGNPLSGTYRLWASVEKENDPNCVVYKEEFSNVVTGSDGGFVITIGTGARLPQYTTTLDSSMSNRSPLQCFDQSGTAAGGYSPDDDDVRKLSIDFEISPSNVVAVGRTRLAPLPYANHAFLIGGHTVGSLLRVMNGSVPSTVPALTSAQHGELLNVISGSSSSYLRSSASSGAVMPSYAGGTTPSSTQAGSLWFDTVQGVMKYSDGSTNFTLASSDSSGILSESRGGTGVNSLATKFVLKGGQSGALDFGTTDTNNVTLKVVNQPALTAQAGGFIGIGTGTPSHRLTVYDTGSGSIANFRNTSNNASVAIDTSVGRKANLTFTRSGIPRWSLGFDSLSESSSVSGTTFRLSRFDNSGNLLGDAISVKREDGKVGIGVTDPQAMLDVGGSIRIGNGFEACGAGTAGMVRVSANQLQFCDGTGAAWQTLANSTSVGDKLDKNLASGRIYVGSAANIANAVGVSGDASLSDTGFITVTRIQGRTVGTTAPLTSQALLYNGSAYMPTYINASALKNQNGTQGLLTNATCTSSQSMYFDSGDGALKCQNITLSANDITTGTLSTARGGTGTANPGDNFVLKTGQSGTVSLGSKTANNLQFLTNNQTNMVLDPNGFLGIGTLTPNRRLHVEGESSLNGDIFTSGNIKFPNVSTPQEIAASDYNGILNLKLSRNIAIMPDGSDKLNFISYQGFDFRLGGSYTPSTYYPLSIRATGNVGIGTSNPTARLEIHGNTAIRGSAPLELYDSTGNYHSEIVHAGGGHLHIDSFGGKGTYINWNGGVGTYIGNGAGTYGPINAASFNILSDSRLKKDIYPINAALEKVKKLQGVSFTWKSDQRKDIGFIAQKVQQVLPELVSESKNPSGKTYKSVQYPNIIAVVVEAVKELASDFTKSKETIRILQSENASLKSENSKILNYLCRKDPGAEICPAR